MEGPSLFLAAEQLQPFVGKMIQKVSGNTKIEKERLLGKRVLSIFSYGKTLIFQFDSFALRVHFLLWGSFEAAIQNENVTGDYPRKAHVPRLAIQFDSVYIEMYSCSVIFIEQADVRMLCDFTIDIMSSSWDEAKAYRQIKENKEEEIGDLLLDQKIFSGVGNIIKNEVLIRAKVLPTKKIAELSASKIKEIIRLARSYVFQFYEWRKIFHLKKHYIIYRQSQCKQCGSKVIRKKTGTRRRMSYMCPLCQKETSKREQ